MTSGEKLLVLYDNMNLNNSNVKYFYINIAWKVLGFLLIRKYFISLKTTYVTTMSNGVLLTDSLDTSY